MVLVIELLITISSALLLNPSVNVLLMLFVSFDLYNTFLFSLSFGVSKHLLAMLLYVLLHSSFSFHFRLEFVSQLFDLTLVHLVNIGELDEFLKSLQILIQLA